jgi:hypothetical protein
MVSAHLDAERALGRIAGDGDPSVLALTVIRAAQLLFADRTGRRPAPEAIRHRRPSARWSRACWSVISPGRF